MRIALVLWAALALAACSGSHGKTAITTTPGQPPPTSATSTATATTSPAQASVPLCRAADLYLTFLGGQGATGHGELGFALRNTSSSPCHTVGYPGVLFLNRAGASLTTLPIHTTRDFFGSAPKIRLTVAPGQRVSFRLGVTHGAASPLGCTTAYGLQVIPPDDTTTLHTSIPDGAYYCRTVSVSPLRPGTSAYP